jgi:SAM-dependent methyltransferase
VRRRETITGTDIFTKGFIFAEERLQGRAHFFQTNALDLPFREEFDVIGAFDVIEHIDDDVAALKEIHKALKPGGGILMMVPRHMFLLSAMDTTAHHKSRYSGAELWRNVRAVGFHMVRQLSFGMLMLPLQYFSRRVLMKKGARHSDVLETDEHPIRDLVLRKLLELDKIPIRWEINYPCGASLMVIAHKAG